MNAIATIARPLTQEQRDKAVAVIQDIENHGNLTTSCDALGYPMSSVLRWIDADPLLAEEYARARAIGLDRMADETLSEVMKPLEPQQVGGARLVFDAKRWYLSKLAPKKYGDKTQHELTGKDGGAIAVETTERSALASELAAFMRQAKRPGSAGVTIDAKPIEDISDLI